MEKRIKEESSFDVIFGRFQGNRLENLLNDCEVKEQDRKNKEELVKEFNVKDKRILDAGIGPLARFSSIFSEYGADVIGIDVSRNTLESARSKINGESVNFVLAAQV